MTELNVNKQFLIDMGHRISKRRKELKMTQEQLAEKMVISLQSVSCIELGKKAIRPDNLVKLCDALEISTDYILTGKKTDNQLDGIFKKMQLLKDDDFAVVEILINHLYKET